MQATSPDTMDHVDSCLAREILDRIGDKWSVYVIDALASGTRRFSELRREVDGVSQRMLTVTLRALERDGLIVRHVYPVIPPRVEYSLTPLGRSLLAIVEALVAWSADHVNDVERARYHYDSSHQAGRTVSSSA
ncbi:MAG TPA: helix-turn-helix domain-containing protein [Streptosporangiaceae bacterium]|nr:helix-turn-helix domain-containing protein [Streptosporangiaceae bacterium]